MKLASVVADVSFILSSLLAIVGNRLDEVQNIYLIRAAFLEIKGFYENEERMRDRQNTTKRTKDTSIH